MEIKKPTDKDLQDFLLRKFLEERLNKDTGSNRDGASEQYKKRLMKITPQVFYKFLHDNGVTLNCLSCGADELSFPESYMMQTEMLALGIPDEPECSDPSVPKVFSHPYVSYTTLNGKEDLRSLRKSYYPVHCLKCGHLSLYRTATVLMWIEGLKKEGCEE